jgi:diguanylate cyclase (GGDEF)-like protein
MKPSENLKEITCLYVEDDDMVRKAFYFMLKRYFKELYVAKNGLEGYEVYLEKQPDIIISDIRMPVMDGIEMVRRIKKHNPRAIVIFITAFSEIEYLKATIDLGVEGYLTKPVERDKLIEKLNFLADMIIKEKEANEYYELIKTVFQEYDEAIALLKNGEIKLSNDKFKKLPKNILKNLDQKEEQIINIDSKTYLVIRKKIKKYDLIIFRNITDINDQLFIDELTNAYNRKLIPTIIEKSNGQNICVIMCDIDKFKNVNDTYGHQFGDKVIREFAKTLKENIRKDDIIIRYGGEEFLIILNDMNDMEISKKISKKIYEKIKKLKIDDINITASFGVCCGKINSKEDFEKLIYQADKALYQAKEKGRNRIELCSF